MPASRFSCESCHTPRKTWIAVGDIHDMTENFAHIPELAGACGLIINGDLTNNGHAPEAAKVMAAAEKSGAPVLAQIGNMDYADVDAWLTGRGLNLHRQVRELTPEAVVFGIGGSTPTPFATPSEFAEDAYASWLESAWEKVRDYPVKILISHNPPRDSACDAIGGGVHVGSLAVRRFIEERQPDVCVCGHIHEAKAADRIGGTQIINPGALGDGGYVLLTLEGTQITAKLAQAAG